ncbi:hypothetical protein [Planctomyces sp. SH-PL14]|uniref:DUF7079 family protein n=1 Tax=Planctomyces sp. SH-PL14 TaxID=1632864 RepID=UPI00078BF3CD|nr:hypothetical protein [Planctomyces sp. SH-PL14]AMV22344.1 hypothetical protein VT03_30900 [Planctomyces sp. SH-PL14]
MTPPDQDLQRRRPVWEALSSFFLDTELDDRWHQEIAAVLVASGYSPTEIQTILWDEVYPVVADNLRSMVGEWYGFDLDWMQAEILSGRRRRTIWTRLSALYPFSPVRMVREAWEELLPFLPESFRQEFPG